MGTLLEGASIFVQNEAGSVKLENQSGSIVVRNPNALFDSTSCSVMAKGANEQDTVAEITVKTSAAAEATNVLVDENGATLTTVANAAGLEVTTGASGDIVVLNNSIGDTVSSGAGADIIKVNSGAGVTVDAGEGTDIVIASGTGHVINGGAGSDILRIDSSAGDSITVNGGAGNDIITVSAGTGHTLTGGAGNDKYVISNLVNGGSYVIDQTGAGAKDRDTLSLAGYRAFDNQGNCNYSIENSNGNTILHYNNGETKADINILGNATNPLSSVIFADKTLRKADLLPSTIQVECSGYMSYDSTNENNIFNIHPDFEGWNNFSLNIKGFTASDKLVFAASAEEMSNYSVNFTCYNKSLSINFLDLEGSRFLGYITFGDFFDHNSSIDILGNHYVFMGQEGNYQFNGTETYVSRGDSFTATICGATDNTNIDLTTLYMPDSNLNPDGISFTRSNNDLELSFSVSAYYNQDYTIANSSLVLKDYFINRPQVGFRFSEEDGKFTGLVLGDDNANIVNLDNLQSASGEKGVFYAGLGGNDNITASTGLSSIFGGAGADTITLNYTDGGANLVSGGLGDDTITVINSQVNGVIQGNDGDDIITVEAQNLQDQSWYDIFGGAGADEIDVNLTNCDNTIVNVYGGSGNDWITVSGGERAYIAGGAGDDVITLDWNTKNSTIISNDVYDEEEGEQNAAYGDKDRLIIKNVSFADVAIEYDSTSRCLIIRDKLEAGAVDDYYYEGKHIRISGWNQVPFETITFEKNKVKENFTTEQINAIFMGQNYDINGSTGTVEGTDKIDTYRFTGTGWNVAIDGIGNGDILDLSAYDEGNHLLKYSYDSDSGSFMLSYYQHGASPEAADVLIGNMVLVNPVLENGGVNIITKAYANGGVQESHLFLNEGAYGQTLQTFGNGVTLVCDDSLISLVNTGDGNDTVYLNAGQQILATYGGSDTIHINSNDNSFIDAGDGEDSIYIRGNNNAVYGQGGNDNYYLYWNSSDNNRIYDYGYNNEVNTLTIYGISKDILNYAEGGYSSDDLIISDAAGRELSINDWKQCFSQGINFDDGLLSVADIEAKIANNKETEHIIDDSTPLGKVFFANANEPDTFIFRAQDWLVGVNNFDHEADLLDFSSYTEANYMLKYTCGGENDNSLRLKLVKVNSYGLMQEQGTFALNNFFANLVNGQEAYFKYVNQYGNVVLENTDIYNTSNQAGKYLLLTDWTIPQLYMNDNYETIDISSTTTVVNANIIGDYNTCYLGSGNDVINVEGYAATVYAGDGNDTINHTGGYANLYGGAGSDTYNINWNDFFYVYLEDDYKTSTNGESNRIVINGRSYENTPFEYDKSNGTFRIGGGAFLSFVNIADWNENSNYEIYFSQDGKTFDKRAAERIAKIGEYKPYEIYREFDNNYSLLDYELFADKNVAFKNYSNGNDAIFEVIKTDSPENERWDRFVLKDVMVGMADEAAYNVRVLFNNSDIRNYTVYNNSYKQTIIANAANGYIVNYDELTTIYGSNGNDNISALADDNTVYAGDGDDVIYVNGRNNILDGGLGEDKFLVAWDHSVYTTITDVADGSESLTNSNAIEIYGTGLNNAIVSKNGTSLIISDGVNALELTDYANSAVALISLVDTSTSAPTKSNYYLSSLSSALNSFANGESIAFSSGALSHYESSIDATTYADTLNKLNITGNT